MSERRSDRPGGFRVLDLMILVGASAAGIAGGRARAALARFPGRWWGVEAHDAGVWLAFALTMAVVAIGLRAPRLPWRRLACRPGMMACVAVVATMALLIVQETASVAVLYVYRRMFVVNAPYLFGRLGDRLSVSAAFAVAGTWATLALGRRWRVGPGFLDWLGIVLGIYWLLYGVIADVIAMMPDLFPGLVP